MKKYTFLTVLLVSVFMLGAQDQEKITDAHVSNYRDWAISLGFGNTFMNGDMKSLNIDAQGDGLGEFYFGPTGYFSVTKYVSSVWGFSFGVDAGQMSGDFGNGEGVPNFETFFINFYPQVTVNLSALALKGKVYDRKWSHIIKAGLGGTFNRPDLTYEKVNGDLVTVELRGDGDERWNNAALIALDYNLKYSMTKALDLDLHLATRHFFGDNIDGFGEGFPRGAASGQANDVSIFTGIGVTFNFGNKNGAEENDKISVIYTNPLDGMFADMESVKEDYEKLTGDDDNDGVSNLFDKDNATPEGATVNGDGVASDVDGDGIPDYLDEDPFTLKGAKVDAQGRAVDSDGDGVPDVMDEEANTEKGALVNYKGVTIPTGGGVGNGGALPSVYFNFNSATVTAANHYRLATIAQVLKNNPDISILLVGYADQRGPEEYNKNLGMRRAEEVAKQLMQVYGVEEGRISTESRGEDTPLADGRYDVNRRVDVMLK